MVLLSISGSFKQIVSKAKCLGKTNTHDRKSELSNEAFCIKQFERHHLQVPFPLCPRTKTHPQIMLCVGQSAGHLASSSPGMEWVDECMAKRKGTVTPSHICIVKWTRDRRDYVATREKGGPSGPTVGSQLLLSHFREAAKIAPTTCNGHQSCLCLPHVAASIALEETDPTLQ